MKKIHLVILGLISLWIIPFECMYYTANRRCLMIVTVSLALKLWFEYFFEFIISDRLQWPPISITMHLWVFNLSTLETIDFRTEVERRNLHQ